MATPPEHRDPAWPAPEETLVVEEAPTRVAPPGPPVPPPEGAPPPPDEGPDGIGYGMLLGLAVLAAVAAAIVAFLLLRGDDDEPAPQTTTSATTSAAGSVQVPDLVGLPREDATAALDRLGFEANVVTVPGEPPAGQVLAQDPAAGDAATEGSTVRLNVSDGKAGATGGETDTTTQPSAQPPAASPSPSPPSVSPSPSPAPSPSPPAAPAQATVPELTGTLRGAVQQVQEAGLAARIQYVPGSDPLGTVLAQFPEPGTSLPANAEVTINVSSGPGDRGTQAVPDTTGQTVNDALRTLNDSGLRLIMLRREVADPDQGGVIVAQTPAPGTEVPDNAQVLVYMGAYTG